MGLAASQARFLAITSRKMNCEFQSMQIAQDKLSVTRDLQSAATKYQNSLDATKLIWTTSIGETYELSYDLLMKPSALTDYQPYLITDRQGRIVLTDTMFQAAVDAGIIDDEGNPQGDASGRFTAGSTKTKNDNGDVISVTHPKDGDGSRDAFLLELVNKGELSSSMADKIIENMDYTKAGIGGEILDKTIAGVLSSTSFINKLSEREDKIENGKVTGYNDPVLDVGNKLIDLIKGDLGSTIASSSEDTSGFIITKNASVMSEADIKDLSLGDLLTGNYSITLMADPANAWSEDGNFRKILETFAELLGWDETGQNNITGTALNVDSESAMALDLAIDWTIQDLFKVTSNTSGTTNFQALANSVNAASNYNGVVTSDKNHNTISLTNMLKSFLTNFAIICDGASNTGFVINDTAGASRYATDDLNYSFLYGQDNSITDSDVLTGDFYNMLYNQICVNGATSDSTMRDLVSDPEYLMQAIKNGQLFISSLYTDGYYYQSAYSLIEGFDVVTDEEAIAQAEMEYEITKAKLNYKEESLDLKMKNIDTELSALTTEYDTVKNLISKNVEKVFTMFSS